MPGFPSLGGGSDDDGLFDDDFVPEPSPAVNVFLEDHDVLTGDVDVVAAVGDVGSTPLEHAKRAEGASRGGHRRSSDDRPQAAVTVSERQSKPRT